MHNKIPNWYGNWIRTPEVVKALDEFYQKSLDAFLADDAVRSNLSDDEAELFERFVETQMRNAAMLARSESEAMELIAREHEHLETVAKTVNSLVDDLDAFPRKHVIRIMVELLKAIP